MAGETDGQQVQRCGCIPALTRANSLPLRLHGGRLLTQSPGYCDVAMSCGRPGAPCAPRRKPDAASLAGPFYPLLLKDSGFGAGLFAAFALGSLKSCYQTRLFLYNHSRLSATHAPEIRAGRAVWYARWHHVHFRRSRGIPGPGCGQNRTRRQPGYRWCGLRVLYCTHSGQQRHADGPREQRRPCGPA